MITIDAEPVNHLQIKHQVFDHISMFYNNGHLFKNNLSIKMHVHSDETIDQHDVLMYWIR